MPHSSFAARRRSKNPAVRSALLDASPYKRKITRDSGATPSIFTPPSPTPPLARTATEGVPKGEAPGLEVPSPLTAPVSAFGRGGPFLLSTENPFVAQFFRKQLGDGGIPTIDDVFINRLTEQAGTDVPSNVQRIGAMLGASPGARGSFARFLGMGKETAEDFPEEISPDLAAEAREMAAAVQNNPFISPEGISMLQRGLMPDPNMIQAAFWRHSDPILKQRMLGLYQHRGLRPEQVAAFAEAGRPS